MISPSVSIFFMEMPPYCFAQRIFSFALLQSSVIFSKLCSRMSFAVATKLPPTATMLFCDAKSVMFSRFTPPVGRKRMSRKTPDNALIALIPPKRSAGKYLITDNPRDLAAMISVGVTQPGTTAMFFSLQCFTTSSEKPGDTINSAPASQARCS